MSKAIIVEHLSKQYRIGRLQQPTMLRERLVNLVRQPFRSRAASTDSIWALTDVSFEVAEGEVVGIVGRNGAGKSTLLKILSRITYPTTGTFRVRGRVASLLEVGTGFHEELTGRENVFLNGSILGMTRSEVQAKFDAIVAFAGVERFVDTPIKRYSSGMRLRLGFAVAAHLEPDVLVVDEVLAVGDLGFQRKCLDAMKDLRSGGRTVLFVSHNMAAVENLCGRGIWIDDGRIRMAGTATEVVQAYMTTFAGTVQASHDLRAWKGRRGSGEIRFTAIDVLGPDGEPRPLLRSGDALTLRLHYRADEPINLPFFGLRLSTELGTTVTETGTWHHGLSIPVLPAGEGHVDLEIADLNVMPGRYGVSLFLTGLNYKIWDALEHCATLDVEAANVYGSGRGIEARWGIVYFPQRWKLNGSYLDQPADLGRTESR